MCDTCRPVVGLLCMTHRAWGGGSIKAERALILYAGVEGEEDGEKWRKSSGNKNEQTIRAGGTGR